jgi:hypothetical protein
MAYLGNGPLLGAYTHVDDISSGFNGTDVTFNLTKNSVAKYPVRAENILVSIDGVFQEPYEAYDVLSNTITFTEAPLAGSSFFGIILGNVLNIGAIPDGSVTIDKMTNGAVDTAQIVDGAVTTSKLADTYLTSYTETNDLSTAVTWANIPDANVPESAVTQHQAALSITESQISDLQSYLTSIDISTYTGDVDITGELLVDSYNETYLNITSSSGTANFDCESGNTFSITLSENVTTTNFQNPPASGIGYTMTIELIQDAGASGYVMAWPTSVDWPSATAPTPTPDASGKDVFVFTTRDGGTTWYGFTAGQALA